MENCYSPNIAVNIKCGDTFSYHNEEYIIKAIMFLESSLQIVCVNGKGEQMVFVPETTFRPIVNIKKKKKIVKFPER